MCRSNALYVAFGNTQTPSPPWVHVVKVVVPMSCCDEAAKYLTQVLGGEETARRLVGGVKWWQVRGINGCVYFKINRLLRDGSVESTANG